MPELGTTNYDVLMTLVAEFGIIGRSDHNCWYQADFA